MHSIRLTLSLLATICTVAALSCYKGNDYHFRVTKGHDHCSSEMILANGENRYSGISGADDATAVDTGCRIMYAAEEKFAIKCDCYTEKCNKPESSPRAAARKMFREAREMIID